MRQNLRSNGIFLPGREHQMKASGQIRCLLRHSLASLVCSSQFSHPSKITSFIFRTVNYSTMDNFDGELLSRTFRGVPYCFCFKCCMFAGMPRKLPSFIRQVGGKLWKPFAILSNIEGQKVTSINIHISSEI